MTEDGRDSGDWHAIEDLLLAVQVEAMKQFELHLENQGLPPAEVRRRTTEKAREFSNFNTGSMVFADVPFPPGVGQVLNPVYDTEMQRWQRDVRGPVHEVGGVISLQVMGTQLDDGSAVSRKLLIHGHDEATADGARQLAAEIGRLAAELDALG